MVRAGMNKGLLAAALAVVLYTVCCPAISRAQDDPHDWPMYNRDVLGSRFNRGETAISKANAGRLEET